MGYRTILVDIADEASSAGRVSAAVALARRFGATLIGAHIMPPPIVPVGYGEGAAFVGPEILEAQREAERELTAKLKVIWDKQAVGLADAIWHTEEGEPSDRLGVLARTSDLTVTGRTEATGIDALPPQMVEDLLHVVGGPVVMLPPGGCASCGTKVLLAWNGRREAARALKDALPFLATASEATLLAIGDEALETLAPAQRQLDRHGIKAKTVHAEAGNDIGVQLLDAAADHDCDLLAMGAYGHSRLRQLMLGGATRHIVRTAPLAVLFSG